MKKIDLQSLNCYSNRMFKRTVVILVFLAGLFSVAYAAAAAPVDSPKAGSVSIMDGGSRVPLELIVLPENPNEYEKLASSEIACYLEKISGVKVKTCLLSETDRTKGVIFVGSAAIQSNTIQPKDLEKVAPGGYIISSKLGNISVAGAGGDGTLYSAYGLLEKLGVRFYAEDCEVIPSNKSLEIPSFYVSKKPVFEYRFGYHIDKLGFTPNLAVGGDPKKIDPKCKANGHHTADYLCPSYKYFDQHPEYFARDRSGKSIGSGHNRHLCLSNPDVLKIAKERLFDWIEKSKNATYFPVTDGDGNLWCQCEKCRALDTIPGEVMSDRILCFVNELAKEVAKKYPDKKLISFAYTPATQPPPQRVKPLPNVMIWYCPYPTKGGAFCQCHDLFCTKNEGSLRDLNGWLAWAPENMYIFDYPVGYVSWYEPFGSFYAMCDKLKFYAKRDIKGVQYCGTPLFYRAMFCYVQGKLLWDPNLNVEELIDTFMDVYYGKAAPEMREYFNFFYTTLANSQIHQACEFANPGLVTPEFAKKGYDIFRRAEEKVKNEPLILQRVRSIKLCGLLWADLNENTKQKLFTKNGVNEELLWKFKELSKIGRINQFSANTEAREWVNKVFGIELESKDWYNDPLAKKIISSDPSSFTKKWIEEQAMGTLQKDIPNGLELQLRGFSGNGGPSTYLKQRAIWIYAKGDPRKDATDIMSTSFFLDKVTSTDVTLVLDALDDDKYGVTKIEISINDRVVFSGPNNANEDQWTTLSFPFSGGFLNKGWNELKIIDLEKTKEPYMKWFMISKAQIRF